MNDFLIYLCISLDSSREAKCTNFFNEIFEIIILIFNSKYIILISLVTLSILIKLFIINDKKKNDRYFLSIGLFFLFFLILINFRTNLPWVDDWEWIENFQLKKYNDFDWLIQPLNIHNVFFIKLIFLFVDRFLNLNFEIFSYLSIIIILLISYIFLTNEKKLDNEYIILIIFLIFSGKQFANFTQASNIAWTICFLFIFAFSYLINKNKVVTSILIILAPLTFGLGYTIPLYVILFIYFTKLSKTTKFLYLAISILSVSLSIWLPQLLLDESLISDSSFNYLDNILNPNFYFTFFAVLANVYLPWINGLSYFGFIIGLIQVIFIIYFFIKNYFEYGKSTINDFLNQNILLVIGFIFSIIVSITRPDLQTVVAARYSVGSIIFQIGFWLYFAKNQKFINFNTNYFIKLLTIYIFLSGLFFPYQGIHWQAKRYSENSKVIKCFKNINKYDECIQNAYQILFYGGKWYKYEDFELQIKYLINNNKSFFKTREK